jgi:thermitase
MWLSVRFVRLFVVAGLALSLTLATAAGATPASAQGRPELGRPGQEPVEVVPGEVLVKFKPGTRGQAVADAHRQNGGSEKEPVAGLDVHVVSVPPGQERARAAAYRANPNVAYAEVNGLYYALGFTPDDPRYPSQWQYENGSDADIDASDAWQQTLGNASVGIAILDTGIDQSHEDLRSKIARNVNFTTSRTVDDLYGHGTHVAGSAAAATNNKVGVAGSCPVCALYNLKVLGDNGSGAWSGIASGITWAADNGIKVVSMSFGSYSPSKTVQDAVDYAAGKGVVLVGAAGNDGQNWGFYPAAYPNVIAVGATDNRDARASFSNYGGNWVSLAAPGVNILSTATDHRSTLFRNGPKYGTLSGTSMATPHVAGVAGLVRSHCPSAGNSWVRGTLESTADHIAGTGTGSSDYWINGRLNAKNAAGQACPSS